MLGLMALWLGGLGFGVDRDEQPSENKKKKHKNQLFVYNHQKKAYEIVHFLFT